MSGGARFTEYTHGHHSSSSSSWHKCSYCSKEYPNLQALGGHQTAHRKEIEQMRRLHEARDRESRQRGSRSSSRLVAMRMAAMAREEGPLNLELTLATGGDSGLDLSLRL